MIFFMMEWRPLNTFQMRLRVGVCLERMTTPQPNLSVKLIQLSCSNSKLLKMCKYLFIYSFGEGIQQKKNPSRLSLMIVTGLTLLLTVLRSLDQQSVTIMWLQKELNAAVLFTFLFSSRVLT